MTMPYRPRSTITRQLTDEEAGLEERANSFLNSPQSQAQTFASEQGRYAWMKRDLEMRDMQTRALQNESALAGELGDKRGDAAQNTKETNDDIMAQKGLDLMAKKVAQNIPAPQARFEASRELGLDLNEPFHIRAGEREKLYETPDNRETRERKAYLDKLDLGKDTFNAEIASKLIEEDKLTGRALAVQRAINDKAGIGAQNSLMAEQIQQLDNERRFSDAKKTSESWKKYGDGSLLGNARMRAAMAQAGFGGITDQEGFVKEFSGDDNDFVLQAMADEDFVKKRFPDDPENAPERLTSKQKIENFAKVINDRNAPAPDITKDPEGHKEWLQKKQRADGLLYEFAGAHANERQEEVDRSNRRKLNTDINKAMEVANKETSAAFQDFSKESLGSLTLKEAGSGNSAKPDVKVNTSVNAARAFLARAYAMSPGNEKLYLAAKQELDDMVNPAPGVDAEGKQKYNYLKDPVKANDEAHRIAAKYIVDQRADAVNGVIPDRAPPPAGTTTQTSQVAPPPSQSAPAAPAATPTYQEGDQVRLTDGRTAVIRNGKPVVLKTQ